MTKLTLINADPPVDARGHIHKSATAEQRLRHHGWSVTDSGCWEWGGNTKHKFGYGQLRILGRGREAHVVAYETWVGPIAVGLQVRHKCDNPPCINPAHLELGTSQNNHDDMVARGRALVGSKNPRAKLSAEQVADIRARYSMGESQTSLGKIFGMSQATISNIVNNKLWTR